MPEHRQHEQSEFEQMMCAAEAQAIEILKLDAEMPGFAVQTIRGVIQKLSVDDALSLVKYPKPLDPRALIG